MNINIPLCNIQGQRCVGIGLQENLHIARLPMGLFTWLYKLYTSQNIRCS